MLLGWLTVIKRINGTVDFGKTWNEYKIGFGDISHEYWIGNDNLHLITNYYNTTVKFELEAFNGDKFIMRFSTFKVKDEASKYQLSISGYDGRMYYLLYTYYTTHTTDFILEILENHGKDETFQYPIRQNQPKIMVDDFIFNEVSGYV